MEQACYYPNNIADFKIGAVVRICKNSVLDFSMIGHVTGFALNCGKEVIISVKLANGSTRDYHVSNLDVLK